jgi:hypothetical protein
MRMAHFKDTIDSSMSVDDAFDYVADFSNAERWDEGTKSSRRLDEGEIGEGSRFELVVEFMGREDAFVYEIVEYERPEQVTLRSESDASSLVDTLTVKPGLDDASVLTYDARLEMKGVRKLLAPVIGIYFRRLCEKGKEGLERELNPT